MRFQLGIQILLILVAIAIAFGVIKPKLAEINNTQNEVAAYKSALNNIGKYNQRLQTLINQLNSMSTSDRAALYRYLPEEVDVVSVSRDITNIIERNRLLVLDITFDSPVPVTSLSQGSIENAVYNPDGTLDTVASGVTGEISEIETGVYSQKFKVDAVGTYDQMKAMLADFERNNYPLRLTEFTFTLENRSSGLIQYSFVLETYALPSSNL